MNTKDVATKLEAKIRAIGSCLLYRLRVEIAAVRGKPPPAPPL